MSIYTDAFVVPVQTDRMEDYKKCAELAGSVWKDLGALEYREFVAEDIRAEDMVTFPQLAGAKENETVVFSYITFESREHRDEVNAKVMKDPRLQHLMNKEDNPFDCSRMAYGGFDLLIQA